MKLTITLFYDHFKEVSCCESYSDKKISSAHNLRNFQGDPFLLEPPDKNPNLTNTLNAPCKGSG